MKAAAPEVVRAEVPLEADGGTFLIPVTVNDTISLKFTIDSGAADVTIPSDVASTLVRAGTISAEDYVGSQTFVLADGSEIPSPEFKIRSLRVGNVVLHDVVASITGANGSLLLGQTFLRQLRSWSIDNNRHVLSLEVAPEQGAPSTPSGRQIIAAANPSPNSADDPATAELRDSAETTVKDFFAAWSNPSDPEGLGVGRYYGESISFFGKQVSLNDLMQFTKMPFAKRWPVRSYVPDQNSFRTTCQSETRSCTVVGTLRYDVTGADADKHASGSARFSLLLDDGRIVGEGGRVLHRDR